MTTNPSPATANGLDRFFAALHRSPITRSKDRVLAGVCGGLAERLGISPAVVRLVVVLLGFLGTAAPLYLAAWLLLPDHEGKIHLERALRQGEGGSIFLLIVTVLSILPDANVHSSFWWGSLATIALVVVVAILLTRSSRTRPGTPPATEPAPPAPPTQASPKQSWPTQTSPTQTWPTPPRPPDAGPQDAPRA